jgi:exodeoxyribonuclease V alpha subunit
LVERVTFFNEESGFAVLKVKVQGHRELVTVVGAAASVNPGEWLVAEGGWRQDREFGLQFQAALLRSSAPTSREGIERYLGSGMIKGIGPVYAGKLVARFGDRVFDIIEQESARLEEIEGIGPERRKRIKAAWQEQKTVREIMVFLHSQGVSTSRAVRIYRTYGETAVQTVRGDPYGLARDIHGIGFKTADQIAQKLGIPPDSVLRARAGLRHVLLEGQSRGHAALPQELLLEEAGKLLGVSEAITQRALEESTASGEVIVEIVEGESLVFTPSLKRAEETIAHRLKALARGAPAYPSIDVEKALTWCEQRTRKDLATRQREALALAVTQRLLVITGGPGVGKTTLLQSILMVLTAKRVEVQLCAPTGRAAKRLSEATGLPAKTIHRLLEVQPGSGSFLRRESHPLEGDLVVVDECSMVDTMLMSQLLRALPLNGSLLLVGDVDQLPSVGPGTVLQDIIASGVAPVVRLTEIFRQAATSQIISAAHRINEGQLPDAPAPGESSDFYLVERDAPDRIAETLVQVVKERVPERFGLDPIRDVQVLCPMHRGTLGIRELNQRLQNELNPLRPEAGFVEKFGWQFRVGDKVIQTENDYDKDVFNGDIGQILAIDGEEQEVRVRFDEREVIYSYGELDELALAYAITIHKSQGSEFPCVIVPLAMQHYMLLQRNLLYTAVTRGKQLVVLVGQRKAVAVAVRNNTAERRYSGLLSRLRAL